MSKNKFNSKKYILIALICPFALFAQQSDFGNWFIYFGDKKLNSKFNLHHEVQYRNFNFIGNTEQLLLRTGLGYNLSQKNNNIHLGYAFVYSEPYILNTNLKTNFTENRIYQQFITRQSFKRVSIQHRFRFEQRFIEDDFKLRLRYFLSTNIALNRKQMENKTVYLSAYNEIFANTQNAIFDRNRLYLGFGYRFSENIKTEIGIMNQTNSVVSRNQLNIMSFVNF